MKNKKGFTLIELLAVIVVLGVILVIATQNILKSINNSKEKTRYMAAKDIVDLAEAYFVSNDIEEGCVSVEDLVSDGILEEDVTNPKDGKNRTSSTPLTGQSVCIQGSLSAQTGYKVKSNEVVPATPTTASYRYDGYLFDGYRYEIKRN